MALVRVAAVSYLNTVPFIYGIRHSGKCPGVSLLLSPPAGCAKAMADGSADIALIPIAEIPSIKEISVIGSHCIGAKDTVRTVVLLSSSPVEKIKKIYLDPHSRTSVALARILVREFWKTEQQWLDINDYSAVAPREGVGYVLIGDKVFGYEERFAYKYDLAHQWHEFTGLPFVFAAWVARAGVDEQAVKQLNEALEYGVTHISEAAKYTSVVDYHTAVSYLTDNIDFRLDSLKRRAMDLFWEKHRENAPHINPG